jgi:hypothetical protein
MHGVGGYADSDILAKLVTDFGEMLQRYESETPEYHQQIVLKRTTDGPFDRLMGYKRLDILKRWREGNAVVQTTTTTWKKDIYPQRFGVASPINIEEIRKMTNRLGSPTENTTRNLMNGIQVFEQRCLANQLEGDTTYAEDALDTIGYDGLSHFNSTAGRFGKAYGNIKVPTANGTDPGDFAAQIYESCEHFSTITDELGYPFFNVVVKPEDLLIIASMDYQKNWDTAIKASFYPISAAVGSTENVMAKEGQNKVLPPDVQFSQWLSGKDYYVFYKNKKGIKPFAWTYGEYQDGSSIGTFPVVGKGNANPIDSSKQGSSAYYFRKTDEGDSRTVLMGEKFYSLYCAVALASLLMQASLKIDIT